MNSNIDSYEEDEISLLDLATTLGEEKKLIFGLPFVAGIVAIVVSLLLTPIFTAKTTLLPPQSGSGGGAAAALASLGGLAGLAGVSAGGTTADTVIAMLKSRSAKDQIIDQFDLVSYYKAKLREDVYKTLDAVVRVSSDKKSNVITIEVDDKDPELAAKMANAYYEVLKGLMTRVAVTEAQQRRQFFEEQFAKAKEELSDAEVKLKETQERTGLVELKSQAEATIGAVAGLRAEVAQREVQLSAMRTFATVENSDYRRVVAELNGLRAELKKLDKGGSGGELGLVSAGNLPEQGLEYVRALREVKYQEAVFEIMAKQFELAKVDEAKDGGNVQQLDAAVPPERKSKPKKAIIVIATVLAAGFLAVLLAFVRSALRKAANNEESKQGLMALKKAWSFKG
ncbi:MAG: lipopolysaccharide biosynthesis protein [Gammaproteobacteria bacterium]|nr:lipopolysaccharide biosynthesis protein [Gammaproteobacteria bacterium]MBU0848597.1 lipopolysaccharide biosynthesis protein [Gammaproteobacteria bacterium]MBU1267266.1 lipopolysaccharide biosynthesis protein [Gammaproteobacteria bacterium]MBU1530291.1 lipopolysaccharide biosynthesis protein [Gammaproteobacteria bacterium]MBU1780194.1 lipopolysaccharide biosynthesis protein [Gammaproteobacteria bacterium]